MPIEQTAALAVSVYKRMIAAAENPSGPDYADLASYLEGYGKALRARGHEAEARAAAIRQPS